MIQSSDTFTDQTIITTQVCIVGTGAAGIPLALEFENSDIQVLLLEAGNYKEEKRHQAQYGGTVSNDDMHSPTDKYRQRCFGGSTQTWGGRCMPFDPIDFEQRDYIPNSGWPIDFNEVEPYFAPANAYLEAGKYEYHANKVFDRAKTDIFAGYESELFNTHSLERFSCPTDMGRRYRKRLEKSDNITCLIESSLTHIQLNEAGTDVDHLVIKTLSGKTLQVKADQFVLAMGGIEIPRIMLASNDIKSEGIGNQGDQVGRNYMCHIAGNVGKLTVNGKLEDVRHGYFISPEGIYCRRRIQLKPEVQKELKASNLVARMHFPPITDPSHKSGILSGLFFAKYFISYEYGKRLKDGPPATVGTYIKHMWNIMMGPIETIKFLWFWATKRTLVERKYPSVTLPNKTNVFSLELHAEQIPNQDSRITLMDEKDALGVPKVHIDWRYLPEDVENVRVTLQAFQKDFEEQGIGKYEFDNEKLEKELMRFGAYGGHHVGTTRMGTDPETSVVDGNCLVHGTNNLFIASSSVFPTTGQANPTLLITAMAIRLADHIKTLHSATQGEPA